MLNGNTLRAGLLPRSDSHSWSTPKH